MSTQTLNHLHDLHDLRLSGTAQHLSQQLEQPGTYDDLPFLERLDLLVKHERLSRDQRKQDRLIRQARFKLKASVQKIDYQHPRGVDKALIARLAQCDWVRRGQNLLMTGSARPILPVPASRILERQFIEPVCECGCSYV
jgi:DNA replication protein DnaC